MSQNLSTPSVSVAFGAQLQSTNPAIATRLALSDRLGVSTYTATTANGNLSIYTSSAVVPSSGSSLLVDLTSLTDLNGQAITASYLLAFKVTNTTSGVNTITVGGAANAIVAAREPISPNGIDCWVDADPGKAIDGTHKILQIATSGGTNVPVNITLFLRG
jgi:hypothetical protein